jgi:phosphate transport system protein
MSKHIRRKLERLKARILGIGAIAEQAIADAISALASYDAASAEKVFSHHIEMERAAVDVEEECLKTLALYQPAAGDLRRIVAVRKINTELELIAGLTKIIAKRVLYLIRSQERPLYIYFAPMAIAVSNFTNRQGIIADDGLVRHCHLSLRGARLLV